MPVVKGILPLALPLPKLPVKWYRVCFVMSAHNLQPHSESILSGFSNI
jgi:hypothetical protein